MFSKNGQLRSVSHLAGVNNRVRNLNVGCKDFGCRPVAYDGFPWHFYQGEMQNQRQINSLAQNSSSQN